MKQYNLFPEIILPKPYRPKVTFFFLLFYLIFYPISLCLTNPKMFQVKTVVHSVRIKHKGFLISIQLTLLPQAEYDIRLIFKGSTADFPSPRLVALPRLKNAVCPTIFAYN